MKSSQPDNGSSGRLSRAATKSVAPGTVDCGTWDTSVPAEQWSSGKLVRVAQSRTPVDGAFTPAESLELEIALRIEPEVNPTRAFAIATQLVAGLFACDPSLGLIYDAHRSLAEEGRVVIVLIVGRPAPDAEVRLKKLAEMIHTAAGAAGGIALNGVRVLRAA